MKHPPLPLSVEDDTILIDSTGEWIGCTDFCEDHAESSAHAAFIVHSVNSCAELLQACRCALADLEGWEYPDDSALKTMQELRAAIQRAEGG